MPRSVALAATLICVAESMRGSGCAGGQPTVGAEVRGIEQQGVFADDFALVPTQIHQKVDQRFGECVGRADGEHRMALGVRGDFESGGGEEGRALGAVAQERLAICDRGAQVAQVLRGCPDQVYFRGEPFVESGIDVDVT